MSEGVLGTALLGIALGSLVSMPLTGSAITRFGSKAVSLWSTYAFCAVIAAIPLAGGPFSLGVVLILYGAAAGSMDVAINAQGVTLERALGRSVLSSLHALFSLGGMLGAVLGGQAARLAISVESHLAGTGLVCATMTLAVTRWLIGPDREQRGEPAPAFALPRRPVLALGALGFCMLLTEGAMADWIAIFLRDALRAGAATAAAGYAVFSAAMATGRLFGDWVTDRLGPVRLVRSGAVLGAAGLSVALLAPVSAGALAGFAVVGLGFAAIVPNVFAASARIPSMSPGAGIAAVTTMGYSGFLIGPPLIGWLAEWIGLRQALFVLVALTSAAALLAGSVRTAGRRAAFEPDVHG